MKYILAILGLFAVLAIAAAQPAVQPTAIFYAAPNGTDNNQCSQIKPCKPQSAVLACQGAQHRAYLCLIKLSAGAYVDPAIDVWHYRFIQFTGVDGLAPDGSCANPGATILRAASWNTALITVQDHATMGITCAQLDSYAGGTIGIFARQMAIADITNVIFGAMPLGVHISAVQFSSVNCIGNIWGGPLSVATDGKSSITNCP